MYATPEEAGWAFTGLRRAKRQFDTIDEAALMVVHDGAVVVAWGDVARRYMCHSVRKSLLSALYGIHVARGTIDLDKTLAQLGIDDDPPLTEAEKQAHVIDLLRARSGVYHTAAYETLPMKALRPRRGSHKPGEFFYYNNWDFNVLGTLFIQLTGRDVFQALYDDFAAPLQMQDFLPANGAYYYEDVSMHPAYHFSMSPRDMARFGLLILREGRWRDEQIVPAAWVERIVSPYSDAGSTWDYGYMWWVGKPPAWDGQRVYAARGGSGQAIFVFPELELVITHKVDNAVWSHSWSQVYELVRAILSAKIF